MRTTRWLLGGFFLLTALGCNRASEEEVLRDLVTQAPWLMQLLQHCEAYKQSSADAARNDLANDAMRLLRTAEVREMRGEVEKLLPDGPDSYALQVVVRDRLRFASQAQKHPIVRGDGLFETVAQLREGDCVVFSATKIEPVATFQQAKICDTRYYADFAGVHACPK